MIRNQHFALLALSVAACALSLPPRASAQTTSFTATGWVNAVLAPGLAATDAIGQMSIRGAVHTVRMEGSDTRVTGQLLMLSESGYLADGTANVQGSAYLQVGTWDPAGTTFTPGAGIWTLNWSGVMQTDSSQQLKLAGYGIGGTIDGQRVQATLTRGPASGLIDETVSYTCAGIIRAAPVTTTVALNDWLPPAASGGTVTTSLADGKLTLSGDFPVPTTNSTDSCAFDGVLYSWVAQPGQTLEARVDLVSMNSAANGVLLSLFRSGAQGYAVSKSSDWVGFWKQKSPGDTCFWAEKVTTKSQNAVLVLALTPAGQNLMLTGKVLDKDTGAVLYQKTVVDTPASDPSMNAVPLSQITGCRVWPDIVADPAGAPWLNGIASYVMVFQDTDGTKPPAGATFANLQLRTYEVPQVSIDRAVQLSWPAAAGVNYLVEGAPSPEGPWSPVQQLVIPDIQKATIPLGAPVQFFRVIQAP